MFHLLPTTRIQRLAPLALISPRQLFPQRLLVKPPQRPALCALGTHTKKGTAATQLRRADAVAALVFPAFPVNEPMSLRTRVAVGGRIVGKFLLELLVLVMVDIFDNHFGARLDTRF